MTLTRNLFSHRKLRTSVLSLLLLALALSHAGCFLNEKLERYYGRIVVPRDQKFNWSDGGLPQTFDPAFATAPPDTENGGGKFREAAVTPLQLLAPPHPK